MRKTIFTGIVAMVVLIPTAALAQLQFDPTVEPPRESGGWVYNAAQLMLFLSVILVILIWIGYMRWSPKWAAKREAKRTASAPAGGGAPELAPVVPKPEPATTTLPPEAAAAAAESVGEAPPTAVAVAEPAGATGDVYEDTLNELLAKGVPQKVAEARAKAAAKKAGG